MSYTIETNQPFFPEVQKVADSQVRKALESLHTEDLEEAIHDIRKRCKKIRALWRLVRDELGEEEYKKRNLHYRDTARLISDLRDATSVIEVLDKLEDRFGDAVYQSTFSELRKVLQNRRDNLLPQADGQPAVMQEVEKRLESGRKRINPVRQSFDGWETIVSSVKRTYGRAYRNFKKMQDAPSSERMHQWRKRSKYLRYQLRLLKRVWPEMINPWREELHALSDWQGDHHDLHELKKVIAEQKDLSPLTRSTLHALATQHQEYCYAQTLPLGKRLFAEKPKHFAKRLKAYLHAWHTPAGESVHIEVAFQ